MLRSAALIAGNDLRRRSRDRSVYILGIAAPILMASIIGAAFGGGFAVDAHIALVDADRSGLTAQIIDVMVSDVAPDAAFQLSRAESPDDARGRLDRGDIDAVIVFPEGFSRSVSSAKPESLRVIVDADKPIAGDVARSIARQVAAQIDASRLAVSTAVAASDASPRPGFIDEVVSRAGQVVIPVQVVGDDVSGRYRPVAYFAPSMAMLFMFLIMGSGARSLITDRAEGTLARVRSSPVTDASILVGKTAGVVLIGLVSMLVVWLVTATVFRASWGDPLAVALVIAATTAAVGGISLLITGLARTEAQADGLTAMVAFVLALLGGNFLPSGAMPELLRKLSMFTPNGWSLRAFLDIGAGGAHASDVLAAVGVLVAIAAATSSIGLWRLRGKVVS